MHRLLVSFLMMSAIGFSQNINFDQLGKEKWLRYNGGISASSIYYDGTANRQPFTYFLNGNLNFNIAGLYNIPLSFTYSNQDFNFANPFQFNRLSLHPSYKWATAHIGDVNMTFSPYTLAGHQFTGLGFDITPKGKFQFSAMYGRLLRATEYNAEEPQALTAYRRTGFGFKTAYDFGFANIGLIFFKARDEENSLENPFPVELGLTPKDNTVVSLESNFRLFDKAVIRVEYALSGITEDTRLTQPRFTSGLFSFLLDENISTNYYSALNASFNYPAGNGTLGVGYERIEPDYRTFGAYFFNNDLENITVNATQNLFNNKLSVSVNAGLQQDNLNNAKSAELQRIVSAINLNYTASDRLGINGSYSNFQSFTNIRDQFDFINQVGEFDNVDTLNYRQVSQNATLGANLVTKKTKTRQHNANLNLVYQTSDNQQEGETIEGGKNSFYNGTASYTWGFPEVALNISLAANTSYNTIGESDDNLILGPTLAVGKQFFDKRLRTNLSGSYNTSFTNGEQQSSIYNFRLGSNYVWFQKHNLSLNLLALFRNGLTSNANDFTVTFGYTYTFDNFRLNLQGRNRGNIDKSQRTGEQVRFRYRGVSYSGSIAAVNEQLTNVFKSSQFSDIPLYKRDELNILLNMAKAQKRAAPYTENALLFLEALYAFGDFKEIYNQVLFNAIQRIRRDMQRIDQRLETLFVGTKLKVDQHPLHDKPESEFTDRDKKMKPRYTALQQELQERLEKLVGHRWMKERFGEFSGLESIENPTGYLKKFKDAMAAGTFKEFEENPQNVEALIDYLEVRIIDFFYKKSLQIVDPKTFELRYINKN